jgi:hypothetical protein
MIHQMTTISAEELGEKVKSFPDGFILYGSGSGLARYVLRYLMEHGVKPLALCDPNEALWGKFLWSYSIISPAEAGRLYGDRQPLVVVILDEIVYSVLPLEQFEQSKVCRDVQKLGFEEIAYIYDPELAVGAQAAYL